MAPSRMSCFQLSSQHKLAIAITNLGYALYDEYKEILKESIEKMSRVNLKEIFKSSQIRSVDFTFALNKIKETQK